MKRQQSVKRTDNRGRILKTGESQRNDGRYAYKYIGTDGKPKFIYSWRLNETDPLPKGKRHCKPLRELEKEILRDKMDGIDSVGKKMTLCQLYAKQNALKPNVNKRTEKSRNQLMNVLKEDKLGNVSIEKIKPSDAKAWAIRMKEKGYAYQSINNYKRSLKAAFYTAINDDLVRKNPFNFKMSDVIENDTVPKMPLTEEQVQSLLSFVKNDKTYRRYYRAIVVLLNTGMRISELCGLNKEVLDFENGIIHVKQQIIRDNEGYHIGQPKYNSVRDIPMIQVVREALQEEMRERQNTQSIEVDGCTDFVFLNTKGLPAYASVYSIAFSNLVKKYNKLHEANPLPAITPHTLRHTFCTNMANKKMSPNNLQYIMGHKSVTMTLGYYAHGSAESARAEMEELAA